MSGTVDSRVVEMHFDNSDFQEKISETIASLEKLNDQISKLDSSHGLNALSDVGSGDMSRVGEAVGNIESRFSSLGIVGMTVLQRLTNAGIDMALKIGNGIKAVGNQIKQGGFVRAENIEQAKFLLEGLGANVEKVMEDVNYAVDGTSYGLDEAARASASFFASGIKDGDQMKQALRGVAGVAAMTGSDYASMADIFTTVAGQGKVMTMQLRMMEGRGLNAAATMRDYFNGVNDGSIEAADSVKQAVKELTGGTKTSEEAVRDFVTQGKIDFDMFSAAMDNAFGEHAQEANKTFAGSLANMKTALSRLGEAFLTPTMEAAIPIFNAAREGISSFTSTLKGSAGTVDQYKVFVDRLSEGITNFLKKLNEQGAFKKLAFIVQQAFRIIVAAFDAAKEAFKEVFPEATVSKIVSGLNSVYLWIRNLRMEAEKPGGMETFKNIMVALFSVIKGVGSVLSVAFKLIFSGLSLISKPLALVTSGISKLLSVLSSLTNTGASKAFDVLSKGIGVAAKFISNSLTKIVSTLRTFFSETTKGFSTLDSFSQLMTIMGLVIGGTFIKMKKDIYGGMFNRIFKPITTAMDNLGKVPKAIGNLSDTIGVFNTQMKAMTADIQAKAIMKIAIATLALAVALKILSGIDAESLGKSLGAVTVLIGEMMGVIGILMKTVGGGDFSKKIKNILALNSVTSALIKIGVAMILMAVAIKIISTLNPQELATGLIGLTVILGAVLGFIVGIDKFTGSDKKLAGVATTLLGIAVAMLILSKAVSQLAGMKIGELAKGLVSIVILLAAIMGFIIGVSKLSSGGGASMVAAGAGMVLIASSINILVPALQKLGGMDLPTLAKGLMAVVVALIAMAGASNATSAAGSAGILMMSLGLVALAGAIERIGNMNVSQVALGLGALVAALVAFAIVSTVLSVAIPFMLGMAAAMMIFSAAIAVLGAGLIMIGAGLTMISAGIISFAGVSSTAIGMFVNLVKTMLIELLTLLPQVAVALAESFVVFLEQIAELAPRFTEAVTTIITSLLAAVENNLPRIIATGLKMLIALLEGIEEAMPRITSAAIGIITGFIDGVADNIQPIVDSGWNLIISFINGIANGIRDHHEDLKGAIGNLCSAILESFKSFFGINSPSTVMEQQGGFLMQGLLKGITSFSGIGSAISGAVSKAIGKIKDSQFVQKGAKFMKSLGEGIHQKKTDIQNKIEEGVEAGKKKLEGTSLFSVGRNIISGFVRGLNALKDRVTSFFSWISEKARKITEKKNEIGSPSKLYFRIGKYIMQGLINGLEELKDKPVKVFDSLSDSMNEALATSYDYLDASEDFSPTITPVLDLSQVKSQAGGISNLLGNQSIAMANTISANSAQTAQQATLMNRLIDKIDTLTNTNNPETTNNFNITVPGTTNPQEFAYQLMNSLEMEARAT